MNRATSATGWARNPDDSPGWTWNPITGCLNNCDYCYARKLAHTRLKQRYLANPNVPPIITKEPLRLIQAGELQTRLLDPFYPRFWEERLADIPLRPRRGIFVCDMSDLFGISIPQDWTERVLNIIKGNPQHRFYLLTKQPQELPKWSPFPSNVWLGVSVTNRQMFDKAIHYLKMVDAKVKFLSFEPLLDRIVVD